MLGWLAKEMPAGISTASPVDRLNTERGNPCSHAILQVEPGCFQPSEKLVSCAAMPLNPSQCCYLSLHLILTQQQIFWPVPLCVIDADVSHPDPDTHSICCITGLHHEATLYSWSILFT